MIDEMDAFAASAAATANNDENKPTATATAIAAVTVVVALVVVVVNSSGIRTQGRSSIGRGCFPSTVLRFILAAGR